MSYPKAHTRSRATFTFTVPADLRESFFQFMQQEQILSEFVAASTLVRMALSVYQPDILVSAARIQAFNETQQWAHHELAHALSAMRQILLNKTNGV